MTTKSRFYSFANPAPRQELDFTGENAVSKTQQNFRQEVDINVIIARAIKTGAPPPFKPGGSYGDFSILKDYATALNMVNDAREAFQDLPSKVRNRFENDPGQLIAFLGDPANYEEGVELGFYEGPREAKVTVPEGSVTTETLQTTNKGSAPPRA